MRRLFLALIASMTFSQAALASADRDPLDVPLKQYGLMLSLALLGGIVSWVAKVRQGQLSAGNLTHLIGELATSAFAGLVCFYACEYCSCPQMLTVTLVAMSGHMGGRGITLLESLALRYAQRKLNLPTIDASLLDKPAVSPSDEKPGA